MKTKNQVEHMPTDWYVNSDVPEPIEGDLTGWVEIQHDEGNCVAFAHPVNAELIARAVNSHDELIEALKALTNEVNLSKLNIRKDFSLINAHAYALKTLAKIEGK